MGADVYILLCRDGSYYVGTTRDSLERRVAEHNEGSFGSYTSPRRPVQLVFHEEFDRVTDAIAAERQLKGWRRAKKEALIRGDYHRVARSRLGMDEGAAINTLRPSTRALRARLRMRKKRGWHRPF